ncbi:MAG: hypothetical protein PHO83_02365, partial [Geobacteraceae bacterium]|nr:hypothetical protein [Geobacteraceae bacterium]
MEKFWAVCYHPVRLLLIFVYSEPVFYEAERLRFSVSEDIGKGNDPVAAIIIFAMGFTLRKIFLTAFLLVCVVLFSVCRAEPGQ